MKHIAAALIATLALGAGTVAVAGTANAAGVDAPGHVRHTGVDGARHAAKEKKG